MTSPYTRQDPCSQFLHVIFTQTPPGSSYFLANMSDSSDLNISLEPHLQDALKPLEGVLPDSLLNQLKPYLEPATSAQSIPTIPYSLLHSISQWSRTPEGLASLKDQNLSPHAYTMISLLAGTTTSPERKFPAYTPTDPHEERKREYSDKKAVTTVVNGLLSVGGSGAATWWAADKVGWKPEWVRVALFSRVSRRLLTLTRFWLSNRKFCFPSWLLPWLRLQKLSYT